MVRINFQPYTTAQLEKILHARLGESTEVLSKDAVKFAAMKVSSISGDARRVLDICRCVPFPSAYRISQKTTHKAKQKTDRRTRTTTQARGANRRREGRHPEPTKLADERFPALALAARADPARRAAQMRASRRRQRDPLGGREPPARPVFWRVCR